MKPTDFPRPAPSASPGRSPLPLAIAGFVLGAAVAGLWFHHAAAVRGVEHPATELADITKDALARLGAPVTLRYYDLVPADSAGASLPAYAARVGQLLAAMEAASGGRLQVVTIDTPAETNAAAAGADGLKVFNLEKGSASYLGVVLASGSHKEVFDRLLPEWEPALEFDLDRALLRVAVPDATTAPAAPNGGKPAPEVVAAIDRLIPDVNATTIETANQIFHAEFMREIADAGTEMEARMTAAQQQVTQAQAGGSPAEIEAAQKNLAQVQAAQGEKVRQIAATLNTRMAVFTQMKNAAEAK